MFDLGKELNNGKPKQTAIFFWNYIETVIGISGCKFENVHS